MEWDHFVVIGIALLVLWRHRDELRNGFRSLARFLKERRELKKRKWSIPRTLAILTVVVVMYRFVTPYIITQFGILGLAGFLTACWLLAAFLNRREV